MSRNFELLQKIGKEQDFFSQAEAPVAAALEQPDIVPEEMPREPAAPTLQMSAAELEEITKLVQRVFVLPGPEAPRSVVFAGTEPGNGSSWMCARAAELLSTQVRGSVCIVDANLRDPGQHEVFGIPNHHGLSDALKYTEPIGHFISNLSRPNLYLMSSGSSTENWQALVSSERMRFRMTELRNSFDYVLIDAAAISLCNDGVVLGAAADGVVLVLKANSSRRESAKRALHELQSAKATVLGAVLNQRTFPIPDSLYHKL